MQTKLLIIIPCYNEQGSIETVVDNLIGNYPQYDYVVINDGSDDKTADICKNKHYNMVDLPVHIGLTGGFQAGMKYAHQNSYDYALQLDGDGQHDPQYISHMLEEMQKNKFDFVIGSRFVTEKKPRNMRMLGSFVISFFLKMTTGKTFTDPTSGMRLYNKRLIELMANTLDFGPEPDTLAFLVRSGAKYTEIQVTMRERFAGRSYLTASWSVKYMARIISSILLIQWFRKKVEL